MCDLCLFGLFPFLFDFIPNKLYSISKKTLHYSSGSQKFQFVEHLDVMVLSAEHREK
jgi:hypothetical protein